jgi:hypothetical protein
MMPSEITAVPRSTRSLIQAEIHDYFSGADAPGFEFDHNELTRRVLNCLPFNFGWQNPTAVSWQQAQEVTDHDDVDAILHELVEDTTADNGVRVVQTIMQVLNNER